MAVPTPGCGPVTEDILEALSSDVAASGGEVLDAVAHVAEKPDAAFGVWEFVAATIRTAGGEEQTATFMAVTYLLDTSWQSTISQEIRVYAVDDVARANSSLAPPDEDEIKRPVSADEDAAVAARACLDG
jgi:hypothetical protein